MSDRPFKDDPQAALDALCAWFQFNRARLDILRSLGYNIPTPPEANESIKRPTNVILAEIEARYKAFRELPPTAQEVVNETRWVEFEETATLLMKYAGKGEPHEFTLAEVEQLRIRHANGESTSKLAKEYNVSPVSLNGLITGKSTKKLAAMK